MILTILSHLAALCLLDAKGQFQPLLDVTYLAALCLLDAKGQFQPLLDVTYLAALCLLNVIDTGVQQFEDKQSGGEPGPEILPSNPLAQRATTTGDWVYLIKADDFNQYKIGRSKAPQIRLKEIQKQSSVSLKLIRLIYCAGAAAAKKCLHKRFAECQVAGKWFAFTDEVVEWVFNQSSIRGVE